MRTLWLLCLCCAVGCSEQVAEAIVGDTPGAGDAAIPNTGDDAAMPAPPMVDAGDAGSSGRGDANPQDADPQHADATVDSDVAIPAPCEELGSTACDEEVWPNQYSRANSDPWLVAYHDQLRALRPRVLVAHFINGLSVGEVQRAAERQIEALSEGSRYHGYSDSAAPAFLQHELVGIVDLTDDPVPSDWPYPSSTLVPVDQDGDFDVAALFEPEFARLLDVEDPQRPDEVLSLCELFSGGHINELWLAIADPSDRHPPSLLDCRPRYDMQGQRLAGEHVAASGGSSFCSLAEQCGVTVRIAHLNPLRGLGCDLQVRGWALRDSYRAIAYLEANARAFMNADFRERFAMSFGRWSDICTPDTSCVSYPMPNVAEGTLQDGTAWRIDPYEPGCGDPEYPPNARFTWDWSNPQQVQTRCAHYGLGDGPGGRDQFELYSLDTVAQQTARWGEDCAGGWQVYWRQSIPGLDNPARDAAGQAMKNWWPFLYY